MLLLFETAAGFALFKVLKEGKLRDEQVEDGLNDGGTLFLDCIYKVPRIRSCCGAESAKPLGGL